LVQSVITRVIRVASGPFAPGHLGELTQQVPFEMIDTVLAQTLCTQRRVRDLPSRVVVYLLLAGCLYAELGYRQVWQRLVSGLEGVAGRGPERGRVDQGPPPGRPATVTSVVRPASRVFTIARSRSGLADSIYSRHSPAGSTLLGAVIALISFDLDLAVSMDLCDDRLLSHDTLVSEAVVHHLHGRDPPPAVIWRPLNVLLVTVRPEPCWPSSVCSRR